MGKTTILMCVAVAICWGCSSLETSNPNSSVGQKVAFGMSGPEVLAAAGPPDRTEDSSGRDTNRDTNVTGYIHHWHYSNTDVTFTNGRVTSINTQ